MTDVMNDPSRTKRGGLGVLFVAAFMTITTETLPMGLLPQMGQGLGASESQVGLLVAIYALVVMLVTLPVTAWTANWPRRRLFLVIMAAFAVSNLLMALAPTFPVAIIGRLIAALVHGVLWSMMAAYATQMVAPGRAGRAVATVYAGNSAALSLGVPLGTALGNALSWRAAFVVLAGVAVLVMAAAPALLPQVPGTRSADSSAAKAFRIPGVLAIAVTTTVVMLGHFTLYTYVAPFLQDAGISESAVSPVLFAFGVAGIAGVWCAGMLVDRRPRGALLSAVGIVVLALTGLGAVGWFTPATITLIVLWGLAYAALPTFLQSAALKAAPAAPAAASALFIIGFNLGIGGGSLVGGQVLDHIGVAAVPGAAAALTAVALLIALFARTSAFPRRPTSAVIARPGNEDEPTPAHQLAELGQHH
ncbi:MFS transporter [Rhodococcus opacus]|uniref:MFS transporter n=2 Tax=Rhodococcus TaxID=1827 RepID=UPI00042E46F4|nr:MFS transporter [Rhodococcus opacus]AHK34249.1 putative sugar efflux transporter [Rhodococcus opacus PD630]